MGGGGVSAITTGPSSREGARVGWHATSESTTNNVGAEERGTSTSLPVQHTPRAARVEGPDDRLATPARIGYAAAVSTSSWPSALASERTATWLTAVTLGVATLAIALPLLTCVYLPFVDYPQHLGTIAAIHGQSRHDVAQYFVVDYWRSQYLVLYVLGDWLAYPFGVEGAGRATAILSIATLPLAVALYLREHGRPAILGAVAAGIALHVYVFWGFLNYSAGMVSGLVALAAMTRLHRAPDAKNALLLALAALLCFYSHAQLFLWFGLACVVQTLALAPHAGWKTSARVAGLGVLAALPSVLAVWGWLHYSNVVEQGEAGSRSGLAAQVTDAPPSFSPIDELLRDWLAHSFSSFVDHAGEQLALEMLSLVLVLIALRGRVGSTSQSQSQSTSHSHSPSLSLWRRVVAYRAPLAPPFVSRAPEAVLALTFALYLFSPFSYRYIEPINQRFLPLAIALLPVLGPVVMGARARWLVAVFSCALSVHVATVHATHFAQTDEEMGDLSAVLAETRPGHRLLGLMYDRQSAIVGSPIYLHAHQYYQARVGGLACFSFVEFPKSPVQYRAGAEPPPFPPRFEWMPESYDHRVYGDAFDYWLVRHAAHRPMPPPFHAPSPSGAPTPVLVFETDHWSLYARPGLATE
jgi:hypothetical protein